MLMPYKHQLEVAMAVTDLRSQGLPIELCFIGASSGRYGLEVKRMIKSLDPHGAFLKWSANQPFEALHKIYGVADAFVFASSCENLPNILIEAMAAGLPIACSNRGPMPEVLGDAGVYFDPESPSSIASALRLLANNHFLRADLAHQSWQKAQNYSWERCANETLKFIEKIVHNYDK
jgi:glycosyltransferase involved in cell wall biosynthesis